MQGAGKPPISRGVSRVVSPADYRRLAAFRQALRRFLAFSAAAARAAGITPQQHQVLLAIKGSAGPETASVGFLAEHLLLQPHSAAELVDRMVKSGLLQRRESARDRRRVVLALTRSAERVLQDLSADHIRELRLAAPVLGGLFAMLEPRTKGKTKRAAKTASKDTPRKKMLRKKK